MPTLYNKEEFLGYLFEVESALSLIAARDCQGLHADTQLSASIYALLRATSLFRASIFLLEANLLDACDVVRRAYWEAWMLGYEFRIGSSSTHAARWHFEKNKYGEPVIGSVKAFEEMHGITTSTYGADYGGLSEVAHPTKSAAENSLVTVTALHGDPASMAHLDQAKNSFAHDDAPAMMYFLVWTVVAEWSGMIDLGIKPGAIPKAFGFFRDYESQYAGTPTSSA